QKYLAECGIASRRKSEELIKNGLVKVNDIVVKDMGVKIDIEKDVVKYKGKIAKKASSKVYIMLNKPKGYITSLKEQFHRPIVTDLIKGVKERVFPVGRLDYNSSGLLILTNDGDLAFKMMHPGHEVNKEYIVEVKGIPDSMEIRKLRNGVVIDGYKTSAANVELINSDNNSSTLRFIIHEGRNRQIRKMCKAIKHDVISLKRVAVGNVRLGDLKEGKFRYLTLDEVRGLKKLAGSVYGYK
ncbi:MAG TPA: pseudouridine synthase, partial [Clostridiaceae bacterium]|nr:pseudouridine synthase [Clostridiaceae bacterium]